MEVPLCETIFTRRMKMLSRPDGFKLYGEVGFDFVSTSEILYPNLKNKLRLIRARPKFHMISDNPDVSLEIVGCTLHSSYCSRGWLSQETNGHACIYARGV